MNCNFRILNKMFLTLFFLILPLSVNYAASSCCSHHGGVSICNAKTGYQQCKDGTTSPSCTCPKSNKITGSTNKSVNKTTGCCSNHGGVAQCNKSKGMQTCKDGTLSTSCKCN